MSSRTKNISKLATIEAARGIFFIVVGLAIKESLTQVASKCDGCWNSIQAISDSKWLCLIIVSFGYLLTAVRFSHGISLLIGHEKSRLEETSLPSSRRISLGSVLIVLVSILLYLMANSLFDLNHYIFSTILMLGAHLILVISTGVIRKPFSRIFQPIRLWKETTEGYQAHTAFMWILADFILIFVAIIGFFVVNFSFAPERLIEQPNHPAHSVWALVLSGVTIADYFANRAFYFGGKGSRRNQKFVFVCSPLNAHSTDDVEKNINLAQLYCYNLMNQAGEITPFASHGFYPYFLDIKRTVDRMIGRQCAIAFLSACDAIYVYYPKCSKELTDGMKQQLEEAKKLGLEIVEEKRLLSAEDRGSWKRPKWKYVECPNQGGKLPVRRGFKKEAYSTYFRLRQKSPVTDRISDYDSSRLRKRVYVCTHLRGNQKREENNQKPFKDLPGCQKKEILRDNIKQTLWECHELACDEKLFVAPFAPQAFFPYFYVLSDSYLNDDDLDNPWFKRSLEVLKVCDAVYIYTKSGLPDEKSLSTGMKEVRKIAEMLGIEVHYKPYSRMENWNPELPGFDYIK